MAGTPVQGDVRGWEAIDSAEQDSLTPTSGLHQGDEGWLLGGICKDNRNVSPHSRTTLVPGDRPRR